MFKKNPKAYFAMRAKLRKEGKWKERGLKDYKDVDPDEPSTSAVSTPGKFTFPNCLTPSMFDNGSGDEEVSVSMQFDTELSAAESKKRKSVTPLRDFGESEDECESSDTKKTRTVNCTIFHEDRDTQKAARQIECCIRNRTDCRQHYRGRTKRILRNEVNLDDRIMFTGPESPLAFLTLDRETIHDQLPVLDDEEYQEITSYFQTYNSLAIVIRTLPDLTIFTTDILAYLIDIKDPYILVCEKSHLNVWHWHMIWFTDKRSDNAKRTLMGLFHLEKPGKEIKSPKLSVSIQQTKSFRHLLKYILKSPAVVAVRNDTHLWNLVCSHLQIITNETSEEQPVETFPNVMVKEIIEVMRKHLKYTTEELMQVAPEIMRKYLHRSNIDSIVQNCKMYLLSPTDISSIYTRITAKKANSMTFFHLYSFLRYQRVKAEVFIFKLFKVLFMDMDKNNCFVIQGPSNTGKTSFLRELLSFYNWGEIQSSGIFMFQNCINKELLIWEEPLIGHDFVENCKKVFEGMATQVSVKYKPPQTLYRTPVLITTNKDLWHYTEGDEAAIKNRCFIYNFRNNAKGYPDWLRDYYHECRSGYKLFITGISYAITELFKRPRCRSELDEPACSSDCSIDSKSVYTDGEQSDTDDGQQCPSSEYISHSACYELLRWWYDNGRTSSCERPDLHCTERQRSSSSDSSSTDDCGIGSNNTAGDTIPERRYSNDQCTSSGIRFKHVPRASDRTVKSVRFRGSARRANSRRSDRGILSSSKNCPKFIKEFYTEQFGSGILKKVPDSELNFSRYGLDWVFDTSGSITKDHWLNLIKLMWIFKDACSRISNG